MPCDSMVKLPHDIFKYILTFKDPYYEIAMKTGAPSSQAIREIVEYGPTKEYLGSLSNIRQPATIICWRPQFAVLIVFCLRRVHLQ